MRGPHSPPSRGYGRPWTSSAGCSAAGSESPCSRAAKRSPVRHGLPPRRFPRRSSAGRDLTHGGHLGADAHRTAARHARHRRDRPHGRETAAGYVLPDRGGRAARRRRRAGRRPPDTGRGADGHPAGRAPRPRLDQPAARYRPARGARTRLRGGGSGPGSPSRQPPHRCWRGSRRVASGWPSSRRCRRTRRPPPGCGRWRSPHRGRAAGSPWPGGRKGPCGPAARALLGRLRAALPVVGTGDGAAVTGRTGGARQAAGAAPDHQAAGA